MPSTFLPLQIGLSALQSSMLGVETAGHNIANANTPGYAREVVDNETLPSLEVYTDHVTYIGTGVNARGQIRIDDTSLDKQYWDNNTQQSYWQTLSTELNQVAQVFNEPSGTTLRQSLQDFFNAWNQLAQSPSDMGARAAVYEASVQVAGAFRTTAGQLQQNYTRYQTEETDAVNQFNTLLGDLAAVNQQLIVLASQNGINGSSGTSTSSGPNDLLDQRDALLDQLSQYAKLDVTYHNDGSVDVGVYIRANATGGFNNTSPIPVSMVSGGTVNGNIISASPSDATTNTVSVQDLLDSAGQLRSLYDMAQYIQNADGTSGVLDQLNTLAQEFMTAVNNQVAQGYGLDGQQYSQLFTGTSASDIQVDSTNFTADHLERLPAAGPNSNSGADQTDGDNAQAIANLMTDYDVVGAGGGAVVTYNGIVTRLGTDGQAANQRNQTFTSLTTQVSNLRQSVRGVDINEEMARMIEYQQTYQAASHFIAVFNEMLSTLIQQV
ncbi:flagellar hook-associated protein FlgK [Alicyclobacillus macrosporangiidus]|uniref:flagellar hook-associated protein FlgK n=1 Tax=Alicyclobacillus macrosporangiidus TaxID=392015 RepID=UPI000495F9D9|nr:flagellar hook-associated protein FlgK [Alicyclobacillus macrosporangiidus]